MIAVMNVGVLVLSTLLMVWFYTRSVSPVQLEPKIGPTVWARCKRDRQIAGGLMGVMLINYVVYIFYPLEWLPLPVKFPWLYWGSLLLAMVVGVPCGWLLWRGIKDAGEETMTPHKAHTLYSGIYDYIRHPQAVGEGLSWTGLALLLHAPFLVIYSLVVCLPVWWLMCRAEEKDLLLRYGDSFAAYRARTGAFFPRRDAFRNAKPDAHNKEY